MKFMRYKSSLKFITNWKKITARTAITLSYKIFGDSDNSDDEPPILIFHGLLDNKLKWNSTGKTILNMTKRAVVTVDLRNHGDSPHVNSHKYDDLAADILYLFDKLSITKASLLGHGMGGKAAMAVSLLAVRKGK